MFNQIEKYGNAIAVIDSGMEISYEKLSNDADNLAKKVDGRTLTFIVCKNSYPSLLGYVSFLRNRIVPLMINSAMDSEMFDNLRKTYRPSYIWQPKGFCEGDSVFEFEDYELIKESVDFCDLYEELALLLTTSGSTGSPKFVKQTYSNIESNTASIIEYLKMTPEDRAITSLPMSYTYGLSIINSHLTIGASIVLTQAGVTQREFYEAINKYKVNNFGGVPYTYEMLLKMHVERMDLSSIRYLTQAGGKLGKENHQRYIDICEQKGIDFVVMYGQTEATARMSYLPWQDSRKKVGSIGIAIPGGRFEIWDVNNKPVEEANTQGELVYMGPNVTLGYATCREELSSGDERHGLLETGDMAYKDEDGYFYICGRKKRFLKVYGNRINLDEVDAFLKSYGISSVAAGVDDLVTIYHEDGEAEQIIELLSHKLNLNRKAFATVKIDEIPRNEAGKVLYSKLK